MNNDSWWVVVLALVVYVLVRHPMLTLVGAVSLVVYWDFGPMGIGVLWPALLVLAIYRNTV